MRATVLSRDPEKFAQKAPHLANRAEIRFLKGDVRNFEFPPDSYTNIVHAGTTSGSPIPPLEMFETIVQGTQHVLDFAIECEAKRFLFVSSGAIYGTPTPETNQIPEEYAGAPNPLTSSSAYGEGKRAAELLCTMQHEKAGVEVKVARCFAFVGPHLPLDAHFAAGNFIRDILAGNPIRVNGDGTPFRSYLYAADLAIWLWTILFAGTPARAYNVGSSEPVSIAELAHLVAALKEPPSAVEICRTPDNRAKKTSYVPSTDRARDDLDLNPIVSLSNALSRTYHWHNDRLSGDE